MNGEPAGLVLDSQYVDDDEDVELRVAFDFDGVLADDEAERVYQDTGSLEEYHRSEAEKARVTMNPGPLHKLLEKIARLQQRERERKEEDPDYRPVIVTAIITARNAPADSRMVHTLRSWGITIDRMFSMGGFPRRRSSPSSGRTSSSTTNRSTWTRPRGSCLRSTFPSGSSTKSRSGSSMLN